MPPSLPPTAPVDDETWDSVTQFSLRSRNTGFSGGTSEVRPSGRVLCHDVDDYLIRHTVARGSKSQLDPEHWRFELDGVVVVTKGAGQGLAVEYARGGVHGFVETHSQDAARERYEALLASLDRALDGDDRARALESHGVEGRVLCGLDLAQVPKDCPLLQHCARQGWSECVEHLLGRGFREGLGHRCKHRMTLLHFVTWEGHLEVLERLGEEAALLCDVANAWGELPEFSGFNRSCQLRAEGGQEEKAEACLAAAVMCRRLRTRNPAITGRDFVDEANAQAALSMSASCAVLPYGVEGPAILQHLPERLRCPDLVARFVIALPPVLRPVLSVLAGNGNLERLVLECCGLTAAHAPPLAELLRGLPALAILHLGGNTLGDAGAQAILGAARGKVQSLHLCGVGMTAASLPAAGDFVAAAAAEKLDLAANDLSEPGEECPLTASFCAACASSAGLQVLALSKTRLQPGQLEHLARVVGLAPALETLELVDVGMAHRFARLTPRENPLLRSLLLETCHVLRVEVSILEYPDLWKALMDAKKSRCKRKGKGQGKGKGWGWRAEEREAGDAGGGSAAAAPPWRRLVFPSVEAVRVKDLKMTHPLRPPSATLCTAEWSLQASVLDGSLSAEDIGRVFNVFLDVKYQKGQPSFMTCASCRPCSQNFAALDGVCLVFHRPHTQEVLLVHDWTDAMKTLNKRIHDFVLNDDFLLQERFGLGQKLFGRLAAEDVMDGLRVQDFSSFEVGILAKLAHRTAYEAWLGRAIFSACHAVEFDRLKESAEIAKLMALFREESRRRSWACGLPHQLPAEPLVANRVGGQDQQRKVDLPACLDACFLRHFASRVCLERSPEAEAPAGLACVDAEGVWCRRLFHVAVPEGMVEHGVVAGLRPSERPASWVRVPDLRKSLDPADTFSTATAAAVERLVAGTPDFTLSWRPEGARVPLKLLEAARRAQGIV